MIILSDDVENTSFPIVNWLLIAINVLVFFCLIGYGLYDEKFIQAWGTVPSRFVAHHDLEQFSIVLTSMFLHGGFLHLIGNMWALYLFGDNVEDRMGHWTYLLFYLVCGLFADLVHIFSDPLSTMPCVGASGAIAGVMGAYIVLHPQATCKTWWGDDSLWFAFRTYRVPATLIIFGWFALQIVCCQMSGSSSNVAFYAHIGGFLAGIALLCFVRYREYQSNDQETVSYGGAMPAVCLTALMILMWHMLDPFLQHKGTTANASHAPTAALTKPAAVCKKPASTHKVGQKKPTGLHTHDAIKPLPKQASSSVAHKRETPSQQIMQQAQKHKPHQ